MNLIEEMVSHFTPCLESKEEITSNGTRYIYYTSDNKYILKNYDNYSGYESNIMECAVTLLATTFDQKFINPVTHASIVDNKVLICTSKCTTPVSLEQLKESELWSYLEPDETNDDPEITAYQYTGNSVTIIDIIMNENGTFDNLGITPDGRVVIIDYGECDLSSTECYQNIAADNEELYCKE